jgi:hypothetical protein
MKYLTAEKLGITVEERAALLKVKRFIKKLHQPQNLISRYDHSMCEVESPAPALFNMNRAVSRYNCGTAGCIGGWMFLVLNKVPIKKHIAFSQSLAEAATDYVSKIGLQFTSKCPLKQLFYPQHMLEYDRITAERAAQEIEKFLTTGHATW